MNNEIEILLDIDEATIENLKEASGLIELEEVHNRFANGTETENDLLNYVPRFILKTDKGKFDIVRYKHYQKLVNLYKQEKEKRKKLDLENQALYESINCDDNTMLAKLYKEEKEFIKNKDRYISKDKIRKIIEEINKYRDIAKEYIGEEIEYIGEEIVYVDRYSVNCGRKAAHDKDIDLLQELLEERN